MNFRVIRIGLKLLLLVFLKLAYTQEKYDIRIAEDSLESLFIRVQNAENDSIRSRINQLFEESLYRTLLHAGSFDYSFDSLEKVTKIVSPDKKFRIYNWNLPKGDGTNTYFGIIQMNPRINPDNIYKLTDLSDSISEPEFALLDRGSWFGCLYYKIILNTYNDKKYYTLLGWDGINQQLSQKLIEILWFDDISRPHFGAKIFRNSGNDQLSRIFFKYSSSASMLLIYDDQYITRNKKWNPSKRQFESKTEKTSMIVCDELIPPDQQLEGQFEFYMPSSEVFNGYIFKDGCWYFHKNVDVRNESQ